MIECLNENRWVAAAKEGGTMGDLEFAFRWSTATEWPCPDMELTPEDPTGWFDFWHKTTELIRYSGGGLTAAREVKIPPHIREYIAIMYVDWKLNGGDDSA